MKKMICMFLSLTIFASSAHAGVTNSHSSAAMEVVDEFMEDQKSQLAMQAQADIIDEGMINRIYALEPEDFNIFLFELMDRYIRNPIQRPRLSKFIEGMRDGIAGDLAYAEALRKGEYGCVLDNAMKYSVYALVGGIVWRAVWTFGRAGRRSEFLKQVRTNLASVGKKGMALRMARRGGNAFAVSLATGAAAAMIENIWQSHSGHRMDPLPILRIVQTSLACDLSYRTLEFYEHVNKIVQSADSEERLSREGAILLADTRILGIQARTLLNEYALLENLSVNDPMFRKNFEHMPVEKNWQDLRKNLFHEDVSRDGMCSRVSLGDITEKVSELEAVLPKMERKDIIP